MTTPTLAARSIGLLVCLTRWFVMLSVFFYLCGYAFDVHERRTKEPACQWTDVPSRDAVPYVARWCYLNKETVLLKLYAAGTDQVLAERMFFELDRPNFYRRANAFGYSTLDGGVIPLPPTPLDRLRTKLP